MRFITLALLLGWMLIQSPNVAAEKMDRPLCSRFAYVTQTFDNGARWTFCWEIRAAEGLRVSHAFYQPPSGIERRVLWQASIGELYVPYDPGSPRYSDVLVGLGIFTIDLTSKDCPSQPSPGARRLLRASLPGDTALRPVVCLELNDRGVANMYGSFSREGRRRGQELAIWSSHQSGEYNYMIRWAFYDDGSFHPQMGITGRQQLAGVPHIHNVYWRLDMDIDGADNDLAETLVRQATEPPPTEVSGQPLAEHFWQPLSQEAAQADDPSTFRTWRVRDTHLTNAAGKPLSYELVPLITGSFRGNQRTEPFAQHDFWVTRYIACEQYAFWNDYTGLNPNCAKNVAAFINPAEPIDGDDVVLWYAAHFYHLPSDEENRFVPTHWAEIELRPRDFMDP